MTDHAVPARLIVMGVTGSGKTTIGGSLAGRLGAAFVDGDDHHPPANVAKMASGAPLTDTDRWPWLDRLGAVMEHARRTGKTFRVVATEARPDNAGYRMAEALRVRGIEAAVALDASVCRVLDTCDCAFVGAEGVCASGGVLNRIGTQQIALLCKAAGRPLYCAAESFKLTRAFPLGGRDAPHTAALEQSALGVEMGGVAPVAGSEERLLAVATRARDYTGPEHITLVITDLGAWAPSAVSEELIMLYS